MRACAVNMGRFAASPLMEEMQGAPAAALLGSWA